MAAPDGYISKKKYGKCYSHLGHFARRFKQQFGINPSQCVAGSDLQKAKSCDLSAVIN